MAICEPGRRMGSSQASKIKPNCPDRRPGHRHPAGRATPGHPDPFRTIALKAIQATSGEREAKRKQKLRQRTSFEPRISVTFRTQLSAEFRTTLD